MYESEKEFLGTKLKENESSLRGKLKSLGIEDAGIKSSKDVYYLARNAWFEANMGITGFRDMSDKDQAEIVSSSVKDFLGDNETLKNFSSKNLLEDMTNISDPEARYNAIITMQTAFRSAPTSSYTRVFQNLGITGEEFLKFDPGPNPREGNKDEVINVPPKDVPPKDVPPKDVPPSEKINSEWLGETTKGINNSRIGNFADLNGYNTGETKTAKGIKDGWIATKSGNGINTNGSSYDRVIIENASPDPIPTSPSSPMPTSGGKLQLINKESLFNETKESIRAKKEAFDKLAFLRNNGGSKEEIDAALKKYNEEADAVTERRSFKNNFIEQASKEGTREYKLLNNVKNGTSYSDLKESELSDLVEGLEKNVGINETNFVEELGGLQEVTSRFAQNGISTKAVYGNRKERLNAITKVQNDLTDTNNRIIELKGQETVNQEELDKLLEQQRIQRENRNIIGDRFIKDMGESVENALSVEAAGKGAGKAAEKTALKGSTLGKIGKYGAGVAILGGTLALMMGGNKGQQTNNQLYGQQPLY